MRATLVLADRPTGRPALVALAAAVEASPIASDVELVLARGPERVAAAITSAAGVRDVVVVAWSFFSSDAPGAAAELARVRAATGSLALHVAGGVHATAEPAAALALGFDLVARGEGEGTLPGLLAARLRDDDPRGVPGLCWTSATGMATSGRAAPVDLDAFPASSQRLGKALACEVTRGCIWACRFCQTPFQHRARFRHRSLAAVRSWARHGVALGHRDFRFLTPSALSYGADGPEARLEAVDELLATVRQEIGSGRRMFFGTFPSELRPEHVSAEALSMLARRIDNRDLLIGGQSGSARLLSSMDRGHGVEEIVRAVRLAIEAGFSPSVDFIVGLPGETAEDRAATHALMSALAERGARVHGHAFLPLPGTPWRDAPPGRLLGATRELLDRLASRGRAYGQWRAQERLGEELGRLRNRG